MGSKEEWQSLLQNSKLQNNSVHLIPTIFSPSRSPGRIVEAYATPFQALRKGGRIVVTVENTGHQAADYYVRVCLEVSSSLYNSFALQAKDYSAKFIRKPVDFLL